MEGMEGMEGEGAWAGTIVAIDAASSWEGVAAEYEWLESRYGAEGEGWSFVSQRLVRLPEMGWADVITLRLADGTMLEQGFDISGFYPG